MANRSDQLIRADITYTLLTKRGFVYPFAMMDRTSLPALSWLYLPQSDFYPYKR